METKYRIEMVLLPESGKVDLIGGGPKMVNDDGELPAGQSPLVRSGSPVFGRSHSERQADGIIVVTVAAVLVASDRAVTPDAVGVWLDGSCGFNGNCDVQLMKLDGRTPFPVDVPIRDGAPLRRIEVEVYDLDGKFMGYGHPMAMSV